MSTTRKTARKPKGKGANAAVSAASKPMGYAKVTKPPKGCTSK